MILRLACYQEDKTQPLNFIWDLKLYVVRFEAKGNWEIDFKKSTNSAIKINEEEIHKAI